MFDKFFKKDVAPNRPQAKSDWIEDQPEDDVFGCYLGPAFLLLPDAIRIA